MLYLFERIVVAGSKEINELAGRIGCIELYLQVVGFESEMRVPDEERIQVNMQQSRLALELRHDSLDLDGAHKVVSGPERIYCAYGTKLICDPYRNLISVLDHELNCRSFCKFLLCCWLGCLLCRSCILGFFRF